MLCLPRGAFWPPLTRLRVSRFIGRTSFATLRLPRCAFRAVHARLRFASRTVPVALRLRGGAFCAAFAGPRLVCWACYETHETLRLTRFDYYTALAALCVSRYACRAVLYALSVTFIGVSGISPGSFRGPSGILLCATSY